MIVSTGIIRPSSSKYFLRLSLVLAKIVDENLPSESLTTGLAADCTAGRFCKLLVRLEEKALR
jgi:hypothetical protein